MTLLHLYVFLRLGSLPLFRRRPGRWVWLGLGPGLWLVFVLGRLWGGTEYGPGGIVLEVAGMHWMGSLFLLAVGFLAVDLATGFGFFFRKAIHRLRWAGLWCGLVLVVAAHVQGLRPPVIESREVAVRGLPAPLDGTTMGVMSDLHVGEMMVGARWLSERVDQVMELRPDAILLAGDLFEREGDPAVLAPVMGRLSAPLGVWAVRGNHDSLRPGRRDVTGEVLDAAGIRLLENEWSEMTEGLVITGIEDLTTSARRQKGEGRANLMRALTGRPPGATILLSHTPWLVEAAAAAGVDLMISGHTHNGQIWPFYYLVRRRYPFIRGFYAVNGMTLLVSRGTGSWGPRMRLWAPGEISLLTLRSVAVGSSSPFDY